MKARALALLIISFIALFASFAYSIFMPTYTLFTIYPLTIMTLIFFLFGIIGFGYLVFLPHIYLGLPMGAEKNALIFVYFLPIALATYAGIKIGQSIEEDFKIKEYLTKKENKNIIYTFIIAIVSSIFIEASLPILFNMELWPKDLLGLNIEGKNAENIFDIFR